MYAGKSKYPIGTRIRIKGLKGEDAFLNGRKGTLTHPFGCFPIGDVGVILDESAVFSIFLGVPDFSYPCLLYLLFPCTPVWV